jgi:hypothetical protein
MSWCVQLPARRPRRAFSLCVSRAYARAAMLLRQRSPNPLVWTSALAVSTSFAGVSLRPARSGSAGMPQRLCPRRPLKSLMSAAVLRASSRSRPWRARAANERPLSCGKLCSRTTRAAESAVAALNMRGTLPYTLAARAGLVSDPGHAAGGVRLAREGDGGGREAERGLLRHRRPGQADPGAGGGHRAARHAQGAPRRACGPAMVTRGRCSAAEAHQIRFQVTLAVFYWLVTKPSMACPSPKGAQERICMGARQVAGRATTCMACWRTAALLVAHRCTPLSLDRGCRVSAGALQVAGHQAAQGRAAVRAAWHGQDAARARVRRADQRHVPQAGGAAACAGARALRFRLCCFYHSA